jgi:hypothetical protein
VISFTDDNSNQLQMIFFRRAVELNTLLAVRLPQECGDLRSRAVIGRAEQPAPMPEKPHCRAELSSSTIDEKKLLWHLHAGAAFCRIVC